MNERKKALSWQPGNLRISGVGDIDEILQSIDSNMSNFDFEKSM